jgi:hypothetical protein
MEWLAAVRDHPEKPAPMQCHVLTMLAVRMDWTTGTGFVSVTQMAGDAGASEHTAKRATSWARHPCECQETGAECAEHRLLHRTKRGHRMYNGETKASEWALTLPVQGGTDGTLRQGASDSVQGANGRRTTCQSAPHNVPVETVHLELNHHDLCPSANGDGADPSHVDAVDAHSGQPEPSGDHHCRYVRCRTPDNPTEDGSDYHATCGHLAQIAMRGQVPAVTGP